MFDQDFIFFENVTRNQGLYTLNLLCLVQFPLIKERVNIDSVTERMDLGHIADVLRIMSKWLWTREHPMLGKLKSTYSMERAEKSTEFGHN